MTTEALIRTRGERWLGVFAQFRPGEGRSVLLFMGYGFLVMFSYYMLKTLREPLLLSRATAETKSYAYAISALILLFGVLITAQFWAFASDSFNVKSGQRVFPVIMIGVSLGGLLGPLVTGSLFRVLGPQLLMIVSLVVLTLMLPLIGKSRDAIPLASRNFYDAPDPAGGNQLFGGFSLVFRNQYLLLLASLIVLLNWVNTTGEYILAEVVVRHANALIILDPGLDKGDIIADFYGTFFAIVNAVSLFMQLFIVSRVLRWIGVHGAILILPIISLIGYACMAFVPISSMIRIVKILENSADYSMMQTARHALYLPLSSAEKYQAKFAIDAFFWRFGDLVQAAAVYIGLNFFDFQLKQFAILNMALAVLWSGIALKIGQRYVLQKKAVTTGEPPRLVQALKTQLAPPGKALNFILPVNLFYCEPGDVLSISVRPIDGGALPSWLKFDAESLRFQGVTPQDIDGNTWLTVRATNMERDWTETRLGFIH
jgi:ATP:ADP antiporter, AAA family